VAGGLGTLLGPEGSAARLPACGGGCGGWFLQAAASPGSCPAPCGGGVAGTGGGGGAQVVTGPRMLRACPAPVTGWWCVGGCGLAVDGHLGGRSYVENCTVDASIFVS
jgi:hypothetical protein